MTATKTKAVRNMKDIPHLRRAMHFLRVFLPVQAADNDTDTCKKSRQDGGKTRAK